MIVLELIFRASPRRQECLIGGGMAMVMLASRARRTGAVIAAGAALLAVSCGGCSGTVTRGRLRPCASSMLRVGFARRIGLYTGHMVQTLVFVNRSGAACTLGGYPAVALVTGPRGRQVGAAASRGPGPVRQVTLAPRGQARATLVLANVADFGSVCAPRQARGLRIYLPAGCPVPRLGGAGVFRARARVHVRGPGRPPRLTAALIARRCAASRPRGCSR
jgi:hypothetical protein